MLQERGSWKLNFRIGERKPPDITPWFRTPGLRPPILKFSFQDPLSCNRKRHRTLCSNCTGGYVLGVSSGLATDRGFWPRGVMSGGLCPPILIPVFRFLRIIQFSTLVIGVSVRAQLWRHWKIIVLAVASEFMIRFIFKTNDNVVQDKPGCTVKEV